MKLTLVSLFSALLLTSCNKSDKIEPDAAIDPTNELVGTTWQRTVSEDLNNYLRFKTNKQVELSSRLKGELSTTLAFAYTLNEKKVIYTSDGFSYAGTISGDTLAVMGTSGFSMIYVKIKN